MVFETICCRGGPRATPYGRVVAYGQKGMMPCTARIMITRSDVPILLAQVFERCLDTKDACDLSSERTR